MVSISLDQQVWRGKNTNRLHTLHKMYPNLLHGLAVGYTNPIWSTDIPHVYAIRCLIDSCVWSLFVSGAGLASIKIAGWMVLLEIPWASHAGLRRHRDIQHRLGMPVYEYSVYWGIQVKWHKKAWIGEGGHWTTSLWSSVSGLPSNIRMSI